MLRFAAIVLVLSVASYAMPGGSYGGGGGGGHGGGGGGGGYGSGTADGLVNSHQSQGYDNFNFGHDVAAPHYNNYHGRQETGSGNAVSGSYYLREADGSMRRVDYVATHPGGFEATITDSQGSRKFGNTDYVGGGGSGGHGGSSSGGYGGSSGGGGSGGHGGY